MRALKRAALAALCVAVFAASFALGTVVKFSVQDSALKPCATEDSPHCYWDSSEQGNGLGHDVVNP